MSIPYLDQDAYLKGVAQAESSNRYGALGPTGAGMAGPAMGKYQLTQSTLNSLVDKYGHPELEGMTGQQRYDHFLNNPAVQEEMMKTLIKDQQNTIRNLGGDPNDPVALGIAHRDGTGDKLRNYIAGSLDMNEKIQDGAGLNESIGDWLGKAGISPPAAGAAAQEPKQMANLGPYQMPLGPAEAAGMGTPMPMTPDGTMGAGFMAGMGPALTLGGGPPAPMMGPPPEAFAAPPPAAPPQEAPIDLSQFAGQGEMSPHMGFWRRMGNTMLPGQPFKPGGQGMIAGIGNTFVPGQPFDGSDADYMKKAGNSVLPGQPFNKDGLAMSEGLGNAFTAGERGDGMQARRQKRIEKALKKSKRLAARGKTKRSARKAKKAKRLMDGERVGAMRWLFGK